MQKLISIINIEMLLIIKILLTSYCEHVEHMHVSNSRKIVTEKTWL